MKKIPLQSGVTVAVAMLFNLGIALPSHAGPSDYVLTPIVEQGEKELELKLGTAKDKNGDRQTTTSIGLGYGVNAWWFTEISAKWNRESPNSTHFDAFEWENKFQLTETGKYPVDVGLLVELEHPKDRSEGWELRWGPLLQAELTPKVIGNFNLLFERHYRAATSAPAELNYQWQVRYRWKQELEWGAQGFGNLGTWNHWVPQNQQEHKAGPALFGKIKLGDRQALKYNAAWLIGTNGNTPKNTFRLQTEYEF
jgi:hypothetical protein